MHHVARMEEGRSDFIILTGKFTGKRPLRMPRRRRWEGNIRMKLKEIGIKTRKWVASAQDRGYWRTLKNVILNLRVPLAMNKVSIICYWRICNIFYRSLLNKSAQS